MTKRLTTNIVFGTFIVLNFILIFQEKDHSSLRDEKRIDFATIIDDDRFFWVENSDKIAYHFLPNGIVKISKDGFKTVIEKKWKYSYENGRLDIIDATGDTTTAFVDGYDTYLQEDRINFQDSNLGGKFFNRHSIEYFGTERKSLSELIKFKIDYAFENLSSMQYENILPYFSLLFFLFLFANLVYFVLLIFLIQAYLKFYFHLKNEKLTSKTFLYGIASFSLSYYIFKGVGWNSFIAMNLIYLIFSFVIRNIFRNYRAKYGIGIPFYQLLTYLMTLPLLGSFVLNLPPISENRDIYPSYYLANNDIETIIYSLTFLGVSIIISILLGRIPYKKGVVIENRFVKTKRIIYWIILIFTIIFLVILVYLLVESELLNYVRPFGSFDFNFYFEIILILYFALYFLGFLKSFFLSYNVNSELKEYSPESAKKVFLYLRSFNQHNNSFWVGSTSNHISEFGKLHTKLFSKLSFFPDFLTFEQFIGFRLTKCQVRLLGLGSPYDSLPNKNLETLYAKNDDWKNTIKILLQDSKKVLFQIGNTENVKFELEEIIRLNYLNKCYVLLPPPINDFSDKIINRLINWLTFKKETGWDSFQKILNQVGIESKLSKINGGAIIGFGENNESIIIAEKLMLPTDYVEVLLSIE